MKDSYQTLLNYSFWLLGRKRYTEAEITKRLLRRGKKIKLTDIPRAAKKVIKRLKELQYVNDDKILEDFFEYRLKSRPQGKFAFLHEMHKRGIPFEKAKEEWEKRDIDEEELAKEFLQRKKRNFGNLSRILRKKKIASLLASRGFSAETVWDVLDESAFDF